MSDSDAYEDRGDQGDEEQRHGDDQETSRVARFFLYKNRERLSVKRAQLKTVMNKSVDSKKNNVVKRASAMLQETLGLKIHEYVPEGKKGTSSKLFLIRDKNYPEEAPIPFTTLEKQKYGILTFIFIALYFKNGKMDLDQCWQLLENAGVEKDSEIIGNWPDQIHIWSKMEYLKEKKIESEACPKIEISYGARFHSEFGEETIRKMGKYLINDGVEEQTADATQQADGQQPNTQRSQEVIE
ncbi:hypothetical protein TVAG_026180 [Trichomonas vaginalis G3]|uniref:MAGE domain-containing protein n=1 Tax=Trichomonas vaginalis (strain ATCC PRA-98 / G3) TaxID=412133 RepID=A2DZ21_TRIV3|nr:melanoma-associated antigen MAGE antigen family [Trichomonas vaginalis G3]EAY14297.1 hypothetical protein TVAG_026180 [Trichomonas vaginalis G3]KAI5517324.1 melanoma-associated antigen MAGE antigen family [Trichomonas vaginalis G3]|eukprot:XP_001326520.1 hypothetical protein [Trichomonas vaginalis G3]